LDTYLIDGCDLAGEGAISNEDGATNLNALGKVLVAASDSGVVTF